MAIPSVEIDGITFRVISYNPEANNNKRRIVYESSAPGREPELARPGVYMLLGFDRSEERRVGKECRL